MWTLPQQLERVVLTLCEDVGSPVAQKVASFVRSKDYGQLVAMTIDPAQYNCPRRYLEDAGCVEFLRKFGDFVIPGIDKAGVALDSFWSSEKVCAKTNVRLAPFISNGPFEDPFDGVLLTSVDRIKTRIRDILGSLPKEILPRFGPGATFRDVGQLVTVPDKMSTRPTSTQETRCLLPLWERTAWARALFECNANQSDPEVVRGNRFTTVPKDARKDRGIAIEPSLNVFYQLGAGGAIRRRLKRAGIDLDYGQDAHRLLAQRASREGSFATIDLSNASDTVSYNLVKLFLPKDWFDLLDTLRSPFTWVNGKGWVHLQKFSSMGNGFTFELETLIFLAISEEACRLSNVEYRTGSSLLVYGDDIILPGKAGQLALALLRTFGFSPNVSKTYLQGAFRESCGGDYFNGTAVRPHYLKESPDEPAKWISLANGIRRMGCQNPRVDFRYSVYWRAWLRALDAVPSHIRRCRGPQSLGDLVIHDEIEFWQKRRTPDLRMFVRTWSPVQRRLPYHYWKGPVVFASALYGTHSSGITPRGEVAGFSLRWLPFAY